MIYPSDQHYYLIYFDTCVVEPLITMYGRRVNDSVVFLKKPQISGALYNMDMVFEVFKTDNKTRIDTLQEYDCRSGAISLMYNYIWENGTISKSIYFNTNQFNINPIYRL